MPLANPSFETGNLSGWTVESGSFAVDTDIAAGITEAADGSFFAYQSGLGSGAISQVVDISAYYLESGDVVTLKAFAADWTGSSDTAELTLEAFDAGGAPVGSASSSTDLAAEDVWEQVSVELALTGTPQTIKLTLAATNVSGGSQASIAFDAAELRVPYKIERPLSVRVYQSGRSWRRLRLRLRQGGVPCRRRGAGQRGAAAGGGPCPPTSPAPPGMSIRRRTTRS